jgi:hypothetical protein
VVPTQLGYKRWCQRGIGLELLKLKRVFEQSDYALLFVNGCVRYGVRIDDSRG